MRTLFIAPLPPPATGHSIAAETLLDALRHRPGSQADVVDLSKDGYRHGVDSARRIIQIVGVLRAVLQRRSRADVVYLTVAESAAGNLKDLLIYALCVRKLPRMVVHLHGGSIRKLLFERHPLIARLNKFFLRRIGAAVILGESHRYIFEDMVPRARTHIVENCVDDSLFRSEEEVREKFSTPVPLRILFLSNLIQGKGYVELLEGYERLDPRTREEVRLDFAGDFESDEDRETFLERVGKVDGATYHGVVADERKRSLLASAHVLCLPTSLLEGQPMCILEAYASGCAVMATRSGGIPDVFEDGRNGIQLSGSDPTVVRAGIERALALRSELAGMAIENRRMARVRFTREVYTRSLIELLESVAPGRHTRTRPEQLFLAAND